MPFAPFSQDNTPPARRRASSLLLTSYFSLLASGFLLPASCFLDNSHHVSAIFLRFVHGFVHPVENRFLVWIGITDFRNAAAHGKADFLLVVNEPGVLDQFAESFGNRARALQVGTGKITMNSSPPQRAIKSVSRRMGLTRLIISLRHLSPAQ